MTHPVMGHWRLHGSLANSLKRLAFDGPCLVASVLIQAEPQTCHLARVVLETQHRQSQAVLQPPRTERSSRFVLASLCTRACTCFRALHTLTHTLTHTHTPTHSHTHTHTDTQPRSCARPMAQCCALWMQMTGWSTTASQSKCRY